MTSSVHTKIVSSRSGMPWTPMDKPYGQDPDYVEKRTQIPQAIMNGCRIHAERIKIAPRTNTTVQLPRPKQHLCMMDVVQERASTRSILVEVLVVEQEWRMRLLRSVK